MAIQRRPKSTSAAEDEFISGAPDAQGQAAPVAVYLKRGSQKGHKRQITLTIAPEMLRR